MDVVEIRAMGDARVGPAAMSELRSDGIAVVRFANPPVNALSGRQIQLLADSVKECLERSDVRGVVICGDSSAGFFSSGADITEFDSLPQQLMDGPSPTRVFLFEEMEHLQKPVVAAVDGICFGGALEMVLCCAARVATPRSSFSLPELKIGLIPGYGGTQRLPRLVGVKKGLEMMLKSEAVSGAQGRDLGLVDAVVSADQLVDAAAKEALDIARGAKPKRVTSLYNERLESPQEIKAIAAGMQKLAYKISARGSMPQYQVCIDVTCTGALNGSGEGLPLEKQRFVELLQGSVAKAMIHVFFAQRAVTKVDVPSDGPDRGECPRSAAVIGGGLMGAGIATAMLKAGIEVTIKEVNEKAAAAAVQRVMKNLRVDSPPPGLKMTLEFDNFDRADIVIEAALEDPKVKQDIFKSLEEHTSESCILATNTSSINIDLVAAKIPAAHAAGRVIGAHFFSPAHKMPLLEIVRTEATSAKTINSVLQLAKAIKKTPVLVGNCAGFCVNRMYFPQGQVADMMAMTMGINPYIIDAALEKFGVPMGPFRLLDLVGLDIGVAIGEIYNMAFADRSRTTAGLKTMIENGWKGQKTGRGYYAYEKGSRAPGKPIPDELAKVVPSATRKDCPLSDEEIVDMLLLPCVNEAARLLHEGVALKPGDVDIASIFGMAFPASRGGLMHWATNERGGAGRVLKRLEHFYEQTGFPLFKPSFALARTAASRLPIGVNPVPHREIGSANDIVVVAAYRTAMGRSMRGGLKDTPIDNMLAPLIDQCLKSTGTAPEDIGDLVVGSVLGRGDSAVAQTRVASFLGGLPEEVPCKVVNRLCSSGLQAIADAAAGIRCGYYDIALAGGAESMSLNPFVNNELRPNPKAEGKAAGCYLSMGMTSENVAAKYGLSRERQDRLAVTSHARAASALLSGKQKDEIVPIKTSVFIKNEKGEATEQKVVVDRDEGVRVGVTMAKVGKLKPVFKKNGTTTPANASQISDGAALTLLMTRAEARRRGLKPLGTFKAFAVAGVDPAVMGIGPVAAIPKVLEKADLSVEDIDVWEVNEAFGSQADYSIETLGLNKDVVNVNGGAIAIGHPLGATGARLSVSILHELHRRNARYGVVSMCIGTGMGAAAVYEINADDKNGKL